MRLLLTLVLLSGCLRYAAPPEGKTYAPAPEHRVPLGQRPRSRLRSLRSLRASLADRFAHPPGSGFTLELGESNGAYQTSVLTYPAFDRRDPKNLIVRAELRRPAKSRGLILVLPILGGDYGPSNAFAEHLAGLGFATLRFDRKVDIFDPEKDFAHVARSIKNGVIDVRRSLDWPEVRTLVSRGAGILGISMGSFVATGVAATDPRIDASVLALGGAGLVEILYSARSEREIGRFFEALEKRGWSDERIREEAHRHLDPLDPDRFAGALDPQNTLMVHARFDAVVPYENGTRLWQAAGRPRRITLLSGHYTAGLYLPWLLDVTADHFLRRLR